VHAHTAPLSIHAVHADAPAPASPAKAPELLRLGLDRVLADPARFGARFYARLFDLLPEARALFPSEQEAQQHKLVQALALLVRSLDRGESVEPLLRQLGQRHRHYGAEPAHYAVVGQALIDSLDACGEPALGPATRDAWGRLYAWVAATMLEGAAERGPASTRPEAEPASGGP
jgi:hemoglobin-like flavoprotein